MTMALSLERALFIRMISLDHNVNTYRIHAYQSAISIGIVSVGRGLKL